MSAQNAVQIILVYKRVIGLRSLYRFRIVMIEKSHRQCRRVTVYGLSVFRLYRIQFCQSVNGIGRQGIFYSQQSICSNDRRVGNVHIQTVFTVTDTFQKFSLRIVRGGSITGNGTVIISQSFVIICSCTVSVLNLCGSL